MAPVGGTRAAWFECASGVSGDMCLAALVDAGAPLEALKKGLAALPIGGYRIVRRRVMRGPLAATRIEVRVAKGAHGPARKQSDIRALIAKAPLPEPVREMAIRTFELIFAAEASVHGSAPENTHLHELGAVDALVDIVGTAILLHELSIDRVMSSPVNLGSGIVCTAHGVLPAPAPATAALLVGARAYGSHVALELTTPTGAAILRGAGAEFGPMPPMRIEAVGTGAGGYETLGEDAPPNVLRVFVGEAEAADSDGGEMFVIEAAVDDMTPEVAAHALERLMEAGARDAYLTPVVMKKGRPGVLVTALADGRLREAIEGVFFAETTTIGLRRWLVGRTVLARRMRRVRTPWGMVRVKEVTLPDGTVRATAEYEDCRAIAREHGVPLPDVLNSSSALLRSGGRVGGKR